jgi:phenylalanyl-tRNA synthetase alpha subunit
VIGNLDDLNDLHLGRHNALLRIIDGMRITIDRRLNGLEQSTQVLANNQQIFNDSLNNLQGTLTDILTTARNSEHNSFLVGQDVIRLRNEVTNTQGLVNNVQEDLNTTRQAQLAWNEAVTQGLEGLRGDGRIAIGQINTMQEAINNMRKQMDEASLHAVSPPHPEAESTRLDELEQRLRQLSENPDNRRETRRPKVTRPEAFDGKKGEGAEMFITQMESYFVRLGDQYSSGQEHIREALANVKSDNQSATHWAQVLL